MNLEYVALNAAFVVLNLGLGALLLGGRPRRPVPVMLGVVFALNSASPLLAALRDVAGSSLAPLSTVVMLLDAATIALLFAIPFAWRSPTGVRPLAVVGPVVAYAVAMAVATFTAEVRTVGILFLVPYAAALSLGTLLFLDEGLRATTRIHAEQTRYLLAAYVLAVGVNVLGSADGLLDGPTLLAFRAALGAALLAVPLAFASAHVRDRARPLGPDLFVVGVAALGVGLDAAALGNLNVLLVRPLLLAYAVLRFRLVGEAASERALLAGVVAAALVAEFLATVLVLDARGARPVVALGFPLLLVLATGAVFAWPVLRRLAAPEGAREREVYAAAVEESLRGGAETSDSQVLRALRDRLGVSDREHAVLEAEAREALGLADERFAPGRLFLGRYRVERLLGEGGFGKTWLARDEQVGRAVVLKRSREPTQDHAERALREARLMARVAHPSVVQVYDVERVGSDVVVVLEYLEGGSLADRLGEGPLGTAEALGLADDVLAGLAAAHAEGVVHRDVKPANVLRGRDGRWKVADFGVARDATVSETAQGFSLAGRQPGSLHYMSPEQVRGLPVDARSDVYSFGAVLYEALAGRPYLNLKGRSDFDARLAILEEAPLLPLPNVPPVLSGLLAECLAKDRDRRPGSVAALRRRLQGATPAAN